MQPNLNKTIEFMSIKLNFTNNESENKFNQISTYTKSCIDNNTYVLVLGDFIAKIGKDEENIVNGDKIINMNDVLLRDTIKLQHLRLTNCLPCCVGKWTMVNTCKNNEKSIIGYSLCNIKLALMT